MRLLLERIRADGYDVVALQELQELGLFDREHRSRYHSFVAGLKRMGFEHQVTGPWPASPDVLLDGGIAIFSRHPFVATTRIPWRRQVSWDAWASKGVIHALVEVPPPEGASPGSHGVRLHVMTLHAQASHEGLLDFLQWGSGSQAARLTQMEQIAQAVREQAADGEAVLVLGDFNFDARDTLELSAHQTVLFDSERCGRPGPPVDVVLDACGGHPPTFGDVDEQSQPRETHLTQPLDLGSCECLDHVYFWPSCVAASCSLRGELGCPRCELAPLEVSCAEVPGLSRVSDHVGWSVELEAEWPPHGTSPDLACQCTCAPGPPTTPNSLEVGAVPWADCTVGRYTAVACSLIVLPLGYTALLVSCWIRPMASRLADGLWTILSSLSAFLANVLVSCTYPRSALPTLPDPDLEAGDPEWTPEPGAKGK